MGQLGEGDQVRVVKLLIEGRVYVGAGASRRPPRVGDTATILVVRRPGHPDGAYLVQKVGLGGQPMWLAGFHPEEISPAEGPGEGG